MGKPKTPAPPVIKVPEPSQVEKDIQAQQLELLKKQTEQFDTYNQQYATDRQKFYDMFDQLQNGKPLTPEQQQQIDDLTNQYQSMLQKGITEGPVAEQFDKQRAGSIASLIERGILNSTSGENVLGNLEKERTRLLADAVDQAQLQRLQLIRDTQSNNSNFDLSKTQLLSGVSGQLGQLANQVSQGASANASGLYGQVYQNRMNQQNVAAQNAQAQYLSQMQNRGNYGGIGSILGAGAALAAAPFTGGLSLTGLAIGSTLGGMAGSAFRY